MEREQDFYPQEQLQGDLEALDFVIGANIPIETLFRLSKEEVDPDISFILEDLETSEDRYYHGLITGCFLTMPDGTLEENAEIFLKRFKLVHSMMINSFGKSGDIEANIELVIIENLDIAGACDFAAFYSALSEDNLVCMSEDHEMFKVQEKACKYWNKMDEIIYRSYEIEKAKKDPDLDQTLKY